MIALSGLRYAAPVLLLLLLAGCSAGDGSTEAKPTATASPSKNPLIGGPAPDSALAPAPSVRSGTDARDLLKPGGDLSRLAVGVPASLERLQSLHIEQFGDKTAGRLSFDVVGTGRCSGEVVADGRKIFIVTTRDGRLLSSADGSVAGRWVEVADGTLGKLCLLGPIGPALSPAGTVDRWVVDGATRVGPERVDGQDTVHFRKLTRGGSIDTWLASEGPTLRLIKLVRRSADGETVTSLFSEFDSAGPLEPEPPADQIAKPGTSTT